MISKETYFGTEDLTGRLLNKRLPVSRRRPDAGSWPANTLIKDVFPEPDGPMMASNRPAFASPLTLFSRTLPCRREQSL